MCIYLHSELPRAEETVSSWIMAAFFMLGSCFLFVEMGYLLSKDIEITAAQ